jgi:hypothetical protein
MLPLPGLSRVGGKRIVVQSTAGCCHRRPACWFWRGRATPSHRRTHGRLHRRSARAGADHAHARRHHSFSPADDRRGLRGRQRRPQPSRRPRPQDGARSLALGIAIFVRSRRSRVWRICPTPALCCAWGAPELIEALGLKDCLFTLDAEHCQKIVRTRDCMRQSSADAGERQSTQAAEPARTGRRGPHAWFVQAAPDGTPWNGGSGSEATSREAREACEALVPARTQERRPGRG